MIREFLYTLRPLLNRYLFAACCVGVSLALLLAATFLWLDQRTLNTRLQARSSEGEAVLAALAAGPALRDALTRVRTTTARINENLVIEANRAENYWYFYNLEERTQVELRDLNQLSSLAVAGEARYNVVPYIMKVSGSFASVMAFLQGLENGPKLAKVRSFSLSRLDYEKMQVTLQLEVALISKP